MHLLERSKQKGFTVLELLITASIITLVAVGVLGGVGFLIFKLIHG